MDRKLKVLMLNGSPRENGNIRKAEFSGSSNGSGRNLQNY